MIDLGAPVRVVAGVELAADHHTPGLFHVLPPPPRVASIDGTPQVELLRFVENGQITGGHLRLITELAHPEAVLAQAQAELAQEFRGRTVVLSPLSAVDVEAQLLFVGRRPTPEGGQTGLLRENLGATRAMFDAPYRAELTIPLSPDGVRMVEAALRTGGAPVGVIYHLKIEGLWPAQRVVAKVDWRRAYDHFSTHRKEGYLLFTEDVQNIFERLREDQVIEVHAVRSVVGTQEEEDADLAPALDWIKRELVERFCEPVMPLARQPARASLGTMGEVFGVGSSFVVKKLTQIEIAHADIDFQRSLVVTRTYTAHANCNDLLGGQPADPFIADALTDHPFFRRMKLTLRTAQDPAAVHVEEAIFHFSYGPKQEPLRFVPGVMEQSVETWSDQAPDRTWSLRPEVRFADDAPVGAATTVMLDPIRGQSRQLTLDLRRLLRLGRYEIRLTPDERVMAAMVTLKHQRDNAALSEVPLAFMGDKTADEAWFADMRQGDRIIVSVQYLLKDGRQIPHPDFEAQAQTVLLPPAFPGAMTVQLIADGDWDGLQSVLVSLRKSPTSAAGAFNFDQPGKTVTANLELPDPADRGFQHRMTRLLTDGTQEEDDWVTTDVPVLSVGRTAANRISVQVTPLGVELPEAGLRLIEVELMYLDIDNMLRLTKIMAIMSKSDRPKWEFEIKDPSKRDYEYRVTLHKLSGPPPVVGPWTRTNQRILVIPIVKQAT